MDGDIDPRKVTVTHFIAMSHEPVNGKIVLDNN